MTEAQGEAGQASLSNSDSRMPAAHRSDLSLMPVAEAEADGQEDEELEPLGSGAAAELESAALQEELMQRNAYLQAIGAANTDGSEVLSAEAEMDAAVSFLESLWAAVDTVRCPPPDCLCAVWLPESA